MLGLSGGIDSALVAYLVAEAIGAERLLVRADARTGRRRPPRGRRRGGRRAASAARRSWSRSRRWSTATSGADGDAGRGRPEGLEAAPLRRGNFMARMRMAVLYDRSVTWRGLVVGTGNKTESLIGYTTLFGDQACAFNPIGDLYKSQVRQLSAAIGVPEADHPQGAVGRPVAGPDRRDRGRVHATPSSTGCCSGGSTSAGRSTRSWRSGFDRAMVERVDRMVAGAEFKRQVPPIAKLGPRTAGVDYLYPRRRPGSARA